MRKFENDDKIGGLGECLGWELVSSHLEVERSVVYYSEMRDVIAAVGTSVGAG